MALYYSLPVYRDTYKLLLLLFRLTRDFQREYKYTLGQDIKRDTMQLVRHIYRANQSGGDRRQHLTEFADDFELVKLQVRLCLDLKLIGKDAFAEVTMLMEEVGRQITGWSKSSPPSNNNR